LNNLIPTGDEIGRALARFVQNWTETVLLAGLIRLVVLDIHRHCAPQDQAYFRRSREERFGTTLEEVVRDREARLPAFRASLDPLRRTVERQDFISGKTPAYADYVVFGAFQWVRAISDFEVLAADHPVRIWRGRMLDLFGGLARRAPGYGD
jgi:glutathione S-transferase